MLSFEKIIQNLQSFWQEKGCAILQPCDIEVGAATLNHFTSMRVLDSKPIAFSQVQFCRRPADARFGENSNRLSGYYQFQVIIKPSPKDIQKYCLESLERLGINKNLHDFRFVEDNWSNPSIGATGVGYEVWCDNMEIIQFTYMEQIGGIKCKLNPVEITYGLERVAMYVQGVDNIFDIKYSENGLKYSDLHKKEYEFEYSEYYQNYQDDKDELFEKFEKYLNRSERLLQDNIIIPAYEYALKASQTLNILDARSYISQNDRASRLLKIREKICKICNSWVIKYDK